MILQKMKDFTKLLQRDGNEVDFTELCRALSNGMEDTGIYLVSRSGKVLGYALANGAENTVFDHEWLPSGRVSEELDSTLQKLGALGEILGNNGERLLVAPVIGANRRLATLLFVKETGTFLEEDTVLAEFASTAVGVVLSHAIEEEVEDEAQEAKIARSAIKSLSYSEILAMQHIFDELDGDEGLLVASRIADEAGITRSVIVNALRKLASANVIESRSLGMKGTYLRIFNKEIRNEFEKQRYPYLKSNVDKVSRKQA